jgi:hypothetical protein
MYLDNVEDINTPKAVDIKIAQSFYQTLITEFRAQTQLTTGARKTPFTIFSDNGKLYVLTAKGTTRILDEGSVNNFFEQFKKTGSTSPVSYHEITFNSSYLLAALKELMEREVI